MVGGAQFDASMAAATRRLADMREGHEAAGERVAAVAAARAPRRTGRLAGSVDVTVTATGADVGSSLVYAPVIHNGWPARNISPSPFLRDAVEVEAPAVTALYTEHVDRVLATIRGR